MSPIEPSDDCARDRVTHVILPAPRLRLVAQQVGHQLRRQPLDFGIANRNGWVGFERHGSPPAPDTGRGHGTFRTRARQPFRGMLIFFQGMPMALQSPVPMLMSQAGPPASG